ncbi:hypothetical protein BH24PSE2_BH24PSE2_03070 [soil metagenome]
MADYRKDPGAERVLAALNERLAALERDLIAPFDTPRHPVVFIVGAPRSGTTLLEQLLLTRFEFGYVDNLIARFWLAPYVGSVLAAQLRNPARPPAVGSHSDYGATHGSEGPHEFGYFWRRWFAYGETHDVGDTVVRDQDRALLSQELAAMESVFDRPLVLKNPVCSFHIEFLSRAVPGSLFVHCRREPVYAAQSILEARMRYHGDREAWFSLRPAAFKRLQRLPYPEQIAGQVFATREAVDRQFASLPAPRTRSLDYEALCAAPEQELDHLAAWMADRGCTLRRRRQALPAVASTNTVRLDRQEFEALQKACQARLAAAGSPST